MSCVACKHHLIRGHTCNPDLWSARRWLEWIYLLPEAYYRRLDLSSFYQQLESTAAMGRFRTASILQPEHRNDTNFVTVLRIHRQAIVAPTTESDDWDDPPFDVCNHCMAAGSIGNFVCRLCGQRLSMSRHEVKQKAAQTQLHLDRLILHHGQMVRQDHLCIFL